MDLGSIPTENVILLSAILSAYIAYQSRINGLESARERERFLNSRLQDGSTFSDVWGITIDNVQVHENAGFPYRIRKFITGSILGESTVVVRYENTTIPESFWTTDTADAILESYPVKVEHLSTREDLSPSIARFKFQTVHHDDIVSFFNALIEVEEEVRPNA